MSWKIFPAAAFEEHRTAWDELNHRGSGHVLLDSAFVGPLIRQFGSERVLLAWNTDPSAAGAMLLEPRHRGFWNTFQPSQAPIGLALMPDWQDPSRRMRGLMGRLPGYALEIGVLQQDPEISEICASPRSRTVRVVPYIETARVSVRGSFEDYWSARGKDLKSNLERRLRRLERLGIPHEFQIVRTPERIADAMSEYGRLESSGWKAGEGTAVSPENAQGRYYREVLETLAARGEGAVFQEHSPGYIMQYKILESVFQDPGFRSVEFYGRVRRGWTDKWTDETRTMVHVTFYRHAWVEPTLETLRPLARGRAPNT